MEELEHCFSGQNPDSKLDLSIGAPGPDILCKLPSLFAKNTASRMQEEDKVGALFQYGPEQGTKSFRQNLAQFLSSQYKDAVDSEELILTTGATFGLSLTASILLDRQAVVFVENPTYFIALNILNSDLGIKVVPVDMNDDGIDCDILEAAVNEFRNKELEEGGRFSCMFYTIPTFHNPTGMCYTKSVCRRLVDLATRHNMLILCDDVYNLLSYAEKPEFSRLKSFESGDKSVIISNGTFSKILSPGIRLGWLEVPKWIIPRFTSCGFLLSGGATNNLTSGIVSNLIKSGDMLTNLLYLRSIYRDRMKSVYDYLSVNLPAGWTIGHPEGGYFLWIETTTDVDAYIKELEKDDVFVLAGSRATPHTQVKQYATKKYHHCIRISIAYYTTSKLLQACQILCKAARDVSMDN